MASQSERQWTTEELVTEVLNEYKTTKIKQLNIMVGSSGVRFLEEYYRFSSNQLKECATIIGNVILRLSNLKEFDRIINVVDPHPDNGNWTEIGTRSNLQWMIPLLSESFEGLLSLNDWYRTLYIVGSIEDFYILCKMISRDKMICMYFNFRMLWNDNKNKWCIDPSKLINAIKSTNTLKEIGVCVHCDEQWRDEVESILKEALSVNYSVTTLLGIGQIEPIDLSKRLPRSPHIDEELHNKYLSWWPQIQKRNEDSQAFNRILCGNQKDDGIWSNNRCPFKIASKVLKNYFPSLPSLAFDKKGDKCFCIKCHTLRKDKLIYKRGKPPKRYALPVEWVRFGLKTDDVKCMMNKVWDEWHVAFHGTKKEIIPKIFQSGMTLIKPGDMTMECKQLEIQGGHIQKEFKRYNKYTKQTEKFDPNQIYMSPSIKYSGHGAYAKWVYCEHPSDRNRTIKVQFGLQLRVQPGSYSIGQETVGAARSGLTLDDNFSNNELEWYTKHNLGIVIHGLLLRVKEVNVGRKKPMKGSRDDEKRDVYAKPKPKVSIKPSRSKSKAKRESMKPFKYDDKLKMLLQMGVSISKEKAKKLLLKYDGDLNMVMAEIFK